MSSSLSKLIFETARLLAFKLAAQDKFFRLTACMDMENRENIAYCEIYKIMFPQDKELIAFIDKVIIPAFQRIGNARWLRTEITDLGLIIGEEREGEDLSYLVKIQQREMVKEGITEAGSDDTRNGN